MPKMYVYVVDRDFGFAPNPFHGRLTLATCKPRVRSVAMVGDWVVGVGGARLNRRGKCIFGMKVTEVMSLSEYWDHPDFQNKKPIRNGSLVSLVGDNIYQRVRDSWLQADSHHSLPDGSPNPANVRNDTSTNRMLISRDFRYFGSAAETIPESVIRALDYRNGRNHRTFSLATAKPLVDWLEGFPANRVLSDPCDFAKASSRYEGQSNKVV